MNHCDCPACYQPTATPTIDRLAYLTARLPYAVLGALTALLLNMMI